MTASEAVLYAAAIGALASIIGYLVAGLTTALTEGRKQRREEQYRIASERRVTYADLSMELRRLIPVDRPKPYTNEPVPDLGPMESAQARVMTLGSPLASEAADKACKDVFVYRKALSQMGFFKRVEAGVESAARVSVRFYEETCRKEARPVNHRRINWLKRPSWFKRRNKSKINEGQTSEAAETTDTFESTENAAQVTKPST